MYLSSSDKSLLPRNPASAGLLRLYYTHLHVHLIALQTTLVDFRAAAQPQQTDTTATPSALLQAVY
jgi:hypothetical protein